MLIYRGQSWAIICEFDCHILNVAHNEGGGMFIAFPISPKDYRDVTPTKAKVEIRRIKDSTFFDITDDWGKQETVEITNDETVAITNAVIAAEKQGLCK